MARQEAHGCRRPHHEVTACLKVPTVRCGRGGVLRCATALHIRTVVCVRMNLEEDAAISMSLSGAARQDRRESLP